MPHSKGARAPAHGRDGYDRRRDLPRVLPILPAELDDATASGRQRILARLRRALRAERRRGIAGHWTYDLARHAELLRVYRRELALGGLPDLTRSRSRAPAAQDRLRPAPRCCRGRPA